MFEPGQVLTVNLPTHRIDEDAAFLIQGVNIAMTEDEGSGVTVTDAAGAGNAATLFNGAAWIAGGPLQ